MNKLPLFALLAVLAVPSFAQDAAPAAPAAADKPAAEKDAQGESGRGRRGNREDRLKQLIEQDPTLKGVDPKTPEGEEKIREAMRKRFEAEVAPQIRQRIAEAKAAQHAKLQEEMGMAKEEFTAIEPLLTRVEQLRQQKGMIDISNQMRGFGGGRGRGGQGGQGGGRGGFDLKMILGDTPMEASVQECIDARKALKALLDDKQSNAAEVAAATARLRKGAATFHATLEKAETELKGVLTPRQEALLVENGILD